MHFSVNRGLLLITAGTALSLLLQFGER